ncbi:MAG: hypothetical protein DMD81_07505 [Candidatus Rokuibacteriota bacterium]|nr:MAG: hypothetical protein DMD81_07505 [Candidatus Rokubacteria bacterium]
MIVRGAAASVVLASLTCLAAASGARALAASFALSEPQKQAALAFGARSTTQSVFDAEWNVANGAGERLSVLTPFHRLAVAARHATFRNEPLKPDEPERMLNQQRDRLVVLVELRGPRADFARFYVPELRVGDHVVKALFVQNERTALKQEDDRYLARCRYEFPNKELSPTARVVLIVRDANGRQTSAFTIDLAAMR